MMAIETRQKWQPNDLERAGFVGGWLLSNDILFRINDDKTLRVKTIRGYENIQPDGEMVLVHVYRHPDWDMSLILEATPDADEQAIMNVKEGGGDLQPMTSTSGVMTKDQFDEMPEWDG